MRAVAGGWRASADSVASRCDAVAMTLFDVQHMEGDQWLSSGIITATLRGLCSVSSASPRVSFLPASALTMCQLDRLLGMVEPQGGSRAAELILAPVCHDRHWVLVAVDLSGWPREEQTGSVTAYLFDSLLGGVWEPEVQDRVVGVVRALADSLGYPSPVINWTSPQVRCVCVLVALYYRVRRVINNSSSSLGRSSSRWESGSAAIWCALTRTPFSCILRARGVSLHGI
jgi:hypothetical protein